LNVSSFVTACEKQHDKNFHCDGKHFFMDDVNVEIDDDKIILSNKCDEDETVEFNDNYELIVNGEKVDLNKRQQELVEEFYTLSFDLIEEAQKIGIEGAKIGVEGATLGLTAVANVLRLLSPDYSSDDFERDMEKKSKKLEKKAERLEKKAEKLEVIVDFLGDIRDELKETTPELRDLYWF
ncbi:DUF2884 family protein, partial [candidate division KSB1 bacterium]|nr:DUF2884 family protein [candidate division KSB1 bacterium]